MRGRKPKPTRLKLLEGNPGKRPISGREPQPPASQPSCPAHLSPTAKAEWKRLAQTLNKIGVLTQVDRAALAAYCQAYGRWVEAEKKLKETPVLLKTPAAPALLSHPRNWQGGIAEGFAGRGQRNKGCRATERRRTGHGSRPGAEARRQDEEPASCQGERGGSCPMEDRPGPVMLTC